MVGVEGSRQAHRSTTAQDKRDPRAQWSGSGHSPSKGRVLGQDDSSDQRGGSAGLMREEHERSWVMEQPAWRVAELGLCSVFNREPVKVLLGGGRKRPNIYEQPLCAV